LPTPAPDNSSARAISEFMSCASRRSMEARLMHDVVYSLIYWPVGIALGSWLFFEIAKRM
jgi:hypothetical protein